MYTFCRSSESSTMMMMMKIQAIKISGAPMRAPRAYLQRDVLKVVTFQKR